MSHRRISGFALALGVLLAGTVQAQIPQAERDSLLALFNSTGGPNWKNNSGWNGVPGTECTWFGISCDATSSSVTDIDLNSNGLAGPLPSLTALHALETINFRFNGLTGAIPPFTGMSALTGFDYGDNQFSGHMVSLQGLTALTGFSVEGNKLDGPLPSLDNLPNMIYLNVQENNFSGHVPSLDGVPAMQEFTISANQFDGPIPPLSGLHALTSFAASYNKLDGSIPSLDGLSNLREFHVSINQLSGPFPSLTGLSSLQSFDAVANHLSGSLPASLAGSPLLVDFQVADNELRGQLPSLAGMSQLTQFQAHDNQLSGGIPSLDEATKLEIFTVDNNQLTGTLPSFAKLAALRKFEAYQNRLDGHIPSLSALTKLEYFAVFDNNLDGDLPSLAGLTSLQAFDVSSNHLTGQISPLTGFTQLFDFEVQSNDLSGPLPSLSGLTALKYFYAYENRLTGNLPSLAGLSALQEFRVFSNQLSGTIPSLTGLANLSVFDVSGNRLTGAVPSLSGLGNLYRFRIGDNLLSGTLPAVPSPNNLGAYYASLCPNALTPRPDDAWDTATGDVPWYDTCTLVQSSNGTPTSQDSTQVVLSKDGKIRVFQSLQTNLTANNGNSGGQDVYSTSAAGDPVLESIDSNGNKLIGVAGLPAVSPDGNVIAFLFTPGAKSKQASGSKDFVTGQMWAGGRGQPKHQVDIGMGGAPANGSAASAPSLSSANGINQLVFCSAASNLVANDANGGRDIFIIDPVGTSATIERISVDETGKELPGDSCEPKLSSDGSKLVFSLSAAPRFGTAARQIVLKELSAGKVFFTGQFLPITANAAGQGAIADSSEPVVSADGNVIAFTSAADLDGLGTPSGNREVFVSLKLPAGRLIRRARMGDGTVPDGSSQHAQLSEDGTTLVVQTAATNFLLPKVLSPAALANTEQGKSEQGKAEAAVAPPQCGAVAISTNFFAVHALGGPLCSADGNISNQNPAISGDGTTSGFDSNAPQSNGNTNRNAYAQGTGIDVGVNKLPADFSGDLSGQWFDPAQNGQGLVIDVFQPDANNSRTLLLTWFVAVDGHPTWMQGAATPIAGTRADASKIIVQMDQVAIFKGKSFPLGEASASVELWGSITLTFSDANNGSMSWRSSYPGYGSGSMPIQHFLAVALPKDDAAGAAVKACYSGNWFNPAQGGHGFELEVVPGGVLAADWFAFAPDGSPVWLQGAGTISGNTASMSMQLIGGSGAQFPPNYRASGITQTNWGTVTFTFTDTTHATMAWNSTIAGYGAGTQPLQSTFGVPGLTMDRRACQ